MYDMNYTTMGEHSDQTLDLYPYSYICLFYLILGIISVKHIFINIFASGFVEVLNIS